MLYALGTEVIEGTDRFRTPPLSTCEFEKDFAFTTTRTEQGSRYSDITVTLHTVAGGKAKTRAIRGRDFDSY
jgi:hypothetical protein